MEILICDLPGGGSAVRMAQEVLIASKSYGIEACIVEHIADIKITAREVKMELLAFVEQAFIEAIENRGAWVFYRELEVSSGFTRIPMEYLKGGSLHPT